MQTKEQAMFAFMPSEWWMVEYHTAEWVEAPFLRMQGHLFATREEARSMAARIIRVCRKESPGARWRPSWRGYDAMEYETFDLATGESGSECVCVECCCAAGNETFYGRKI